MYGITESTGNGTQIIAILDTGVDYDHPDLAANIWSNSEEKDGVEVMMMMETVILMILEDGITITKLIPP